jgi:hypothetical protein
LLFRPLVGSLTVPDSVQWWDFQFRSAGDVRILASFQVLISDGLVIAVKCADALWSFIVFVGEGFVYPCLFVSLL